RRASFRWRTPRPSRPRLRRPLSVKPMPRLSPRAPRSVRCGRRRGARARAPGALEASRRPRPLLLAPKVRYLRAWQIPRRPRRDMTFFRSAVVLLLSVCWASAAHAQPSAQDIETARQLYNEGLSLRDEGDMEGALEKFRAAHALGNTPLTGIELCRAHAALRQPVEAREACLAVGRIPFMRQETSRSKNARQEAARIAEVERGKIGSLRVKIMGVPVGREATVTIDGALVPPEALDAPRALNPGVHVITARVDDGPE